MSGRSRVELRVLAGAGAVIATSWLPAHLIPAAREMALDYALSFLLVIVVVGLLWWAGRRSTDNRLFWSLLAAGWTLNLLGNISWGAYEMVTGKELPPTSWIDVLYTARQILVLIALWGFWGRLAGRRWEGASAVALAATAMLWPAFRSALTLPGARFSNPAAFLGTANYPVLDAVLTYTALSVWASVQTRRVRNWVGLLTLMMVSYGMANWIQFADLILPHFASGLPDLFWLLADVFAGSAVVYAFWREPPREALMARETALTRWLDRTVYPAGLVAIGLAAGDLAARGGAVDYVMIGCAVIALGVMVHHRWRGRIGDPGIGEGE